MGDVGNRIGHLVDATLEQDSREFEAYLLRADNFERVLGQRGRIQPDKVHACSRELMLVTTGRVKAMEVAPEEQTEATTREVPLPLKEADRLPSPPSYEPVADGRPVSAPRP